MNDQASITTKQTRVAAYQAAISRLESENSKLEGGDSDGKLGINDQGMTIWSKDLNEIRSNNYAIADATNRMRMLEKQLKEIM